MAPLSDAGLQRAKAEITAWDGYEVTPSRDLPALARQAGLACGEPSVLAWQELNHAAAARELLGQNVSSRVVAFNTEGATDPAPYARLVGIQPGSVGI